MTPTDPEFDQPKAKRRWFPLSRTEVYVLTFLFVVCGICLVVWLLRQPPGWTLDHDRKRFNQIQAAIDADPHHLLGKSLDQVTKELGLENVPWDDGSTQNGPGTYRLYHFQGFALYVTLQNLPAGIAPGEMVGRSFTSEELSRPEVPWLLNYNPYIVIDGIRDGKERIAKFWKAADESVKQINDEMKRKRERP
jgi:hypothetical protein